MRSAGSGIPHRSARAGAAHPARHRPNGVPHRASRLIDVLLLICSQPGWTAAKLAARHGISRRRVFEDLNVLRAAGVRVVASGHGFRSPPGPLHERVHLTAADVCHLLRPPDFGSEAAHIARRRVAGALPKAIRALFDAPARVRLAPQVAPVPPGLLQRIEDALANHLTLRLVYRGTRDARPELRRVDPYALFARGTGWYLAAWCHERSDYRLFRLDRAETATPLERRFQRRPDFSLDDWHHDSLGVWRGGTLDGVVEVRPGYETVLRSEAAALGLPFRRRSGGGAVLEIPRGHLDGTAWWLAQFGEGVRVVRPERLRQRLVAVGEAIVRTNAASVEGVKQGVQRQGDFRTCGPRPVVQGARGSRQGVGAGIRSGDA